jgi:peptidoglycan/xylan/chitin deacetylase (PgdA/CDA1 family)
MKQKIKRLIYSIGLMSLYHRFRNRNTLTVLMFHRILPTKLAIEQGADPEWTLSPELLDSLIKFVKQNYNLVSLKQLQNWQQKKETLPSRALLLTFDDGWADNCIFALPIIKKNNVAAVIHQVSDCVDNVDFLWQEQLVILSKLNPLSYQRLVNHIQFSGESVVDLITDIGHDVFRITQIKEQLILFFPEAETMMLSKVDLQKMLVGGFELSSHGKTHSKLTNLNNIEIEAELSESKRALETINETAVTSISFPHGGVNTDIIQASTKAGYSTLFTSAPVVNELKQHSKIFGRVHISTKLISEAGKFSAKEMAYLLFNRKKITLK